MPLIRIADTEYCDGAEQFTDLADLLAANPDDAELIAAVPRLEAGETVVLGGGAAPLIFLRRIL
jgi:hypothetical protein